MLRQIASQLDKARETSVKFLKKQKTKKKNKKVLHWVKSGELSQSSLKDVPDSLPLWNIQVQYSKTIVVVYALIGFSNGEQPKYSHALLIIYTSQCKSLPSECWLSKYCTACLFSWAY